MRRIHWHVLYEFMHVSGGIERIEKLAYLVWTHNL